MEKPEWFETVEASESTPKPIKKSSAPSNRVRLTQGLALLGIASVIAVGGFNFVQSANAPSTLTTLTTLTTLSASAAPVATSSASSSTTTPTPTTSTAVANASPAIGLGGGRPTITSAVGGEGND